MDFYIIKMASKTLKNITDDEFKDIIKSSLTWLEAISKCGLKTKSRNFEIRINNLSDEYKKHLPLNYGGIYSKIEKYSHDFYKDLIKNSNNWDEVIETLKITNQNYLNNLKKHLDTINIDYNHLIKNNKIKHCKIRKLEEILVVNSTHSGSMTTIKKRLINELGWKWECSGCNKSTHSTHWTGEVKIPLQVDHINGDRTNNSWDNVLEELNFTSIQVMNNVKKHLDTINIDYKHLSYPIKLKQNRCSKLEDILVENSQYCYGSMNNIKERLINELKWEHKCSGCDNTTHFTNWTGEVPIPLQVDHINGIRTDNRIENLRFLCGTCHSLTDNWCKNMKDSIENKEKPLINEIIENKSKPKKEEPKCINCGVKVSRKGNRCLSCDNKNRFIIASKDRPSLEQLKTDLQENGNNFCAVARIYKVSDNCIRKWIKKYELRDA